VRGEILLVKHVRVIVHHVDGPAEGLVLDWRKEGEVLQGLVTYEVRDRVVTDWVPAMSLSPVDEEPAPVADGPDPAQSPG
jgi:hypothetical protein